MGYPHGKKGWKLYDLETGEFFVSRDVKFYENEFPFSKENATENSLDDALVVKNNVVDDVVWTNESLQHSSTPDMEQTDEHSLSSDISVDTVPDEVTSTSSTSIVMPPNNRSDEEVEQPQGHGFRDKRPFVKLRDYVTNTVRKLSPSLSPSVTTLQHA